MNHDWGLMALRFLTGLSCAVLLLSDVLPAQAQQDAPKVQVRKLGINSTVGELLANPAARAILEREVPVLVQNDQIYAARDLPFRALAQYAPTVLTPAKLTAIETALAAAPDAVANGSPKATLKPVDWTQPLSLKTVPLWEGKAPGSLGTRPQDMPTLTIVRPDEATSFGSAIIVAPGGGYKGLATGLEGRQVADWFAANGVTAFILSYRLTPFGYKHPVQLGDATRAVRWVRSHADEYGLNPGKIGMIGFSAGGHLTAMLSTQFDAGNPDASDAVEKVSSRPDFAILGYPAIDLPNNRWDSIGIRDESQSPAVLSQLAPAKHVRKNGPPTFIVHTTADELVPPGNSTLYYDALTKVGVPAELHIFAQGRHGLGLGQSDDSLSLWPVLLRNWLSKNAIIGSAALKQSGGSK